ncbi:hypothetical protein D3C84_315120 [compost metagenome]
MEGTHALAGLGGVEGVLPEAQHPEQLLAQLGAGGVGEGNHRQPSRLDAQMTEHEHHSQHQGGGLARARPGEDPRERMATEDHRPLLVRRRTDHPCRHRLGDPRAHGLDLRRIDRQQRRPVDGRAGRLVWLGAGPGRLFPSARLALARRSASLLRPHPRLLLRHPRLALGAQIGRGARKITRQGTGEEQLVTPDGRQHATITPWA